MTSYLVTIQVTNLQANKALSLNFTDGASTWSVSSANVRVPGLTMVGVPSTGGLPLTSLSLSSGQLQLIGGASAGSVTITAHIESSAAMASGYTDTGGDTNVRVTYQTGSGLESDMMGDWTVALT